MERMLGKRVELVMYEDDFRSLLLIYVATFVVAEE
jgi:hypothetical protein